MRSPAAQPDGLQQERTMLAWRRSALAFIVLGLIVARAAATSGAPVSAVLGTVAVVVSLALVAFSQRTSLWRSPSLAEPRFRSVLHDGIFPALVAGVAVLLCLAVLAMSFMT